MSEMDGLLADLTSGEDERSENAVPGLVALGACILPEIEKLLVSEVIDHRWWGVRVLAQYPEPQSKWLIQALADREQEVRQCAALALVSHPAPEAIPALIDAMFDPDVTLSGIAATALTAIGEPAVEALLTKLPGSSEHARINMFRVLARICDRRAIPVLMEAMKEDSALIQYWAEEGLHRLGLDMVYTKPD
ncbi:MAG: HEAT repeat domain-containing protein [Anaerolineales bacterium]|nr:HEAT repeat domain-containing protein [Anaerolineales bacterium]